MSEPNYVLEMIEGMSRAEISSYALRLASRVTELEAENAKLRQATESAARAFRYYGKEVFGADGFTDRHGDEERCLSLAEMMLNALDAARADLDKPDAARAETGG